MNKALLRSALSPIPVALATSIIVSLVMIAINVRLVSEIRQLQTILDNEAMVQAPREGSHIKLLKGTDRKGSVEEINLTTQRTPILAIVMSPQCRYCQAEIPTWKHLAQINNSVRFLFINLSEEDDRAFLASIPLPPDTLHINLNKLEASLHDFQVTPTTLIIDAGGKVIWSWPGILGDEQERHLEHLLHPL